MKRIFLDWIIPILSAILLSVIIKKYVFTVASVPTPSMRPTILEGDRLIVTRVYNPEKLQTGDVVVFYFKEEDEKFVKRLIGKPGDTVEIFEDGSVKVNGKQLDDSYVYERENVSDVYQKYEVQEDSYFFLGDNRNNSKDSRKWVTSPYIKEKDIEGKAQFTIFPFNRVGKLKSYGYLN
ncbi:signal peptidase I [Clostridium bornimense]|uniref:signal peptidase I n=1 Tax=Clostridium bornimense TaxID=1216932 RepID=UPI001C0F4296|nr:signal peptidase I [Clostridium bornimense]MBU5316246.1 signal peptidase I [Clostridium bornimense]